MHTKHAFILQSTLKQAAINEGKVVNVQVHDSGRILGTVHVMLWNLGCQVSLVTCCLACDGSDHAHYCASEKLRVQQMTLRSY